MSKTRIWFIGIGLTSRWRHQMETFSALLVIFPGNSSVLGEFPAQRPVTGSFDVFFDLRLNKQLSKQLWGWWFQMLSCPLWRHCNVVFRPQNCQAEASIICPEITHNKTGIFFKFSPWRRYCILCLYQKLLNDIQIRCIRLNFTWSITWN